MNIKFSYLPECIKHYIFTFIRIPQVLKKHIIDDLLSNISNKDRNYFWLGLNHNINSIDLLKKYKHKISWSHIFNNTNACDIIENNMNYINTISAWENISNNSGLINIIEKNLDKINNFSLNTNKSAINIIKQNPNKIIWSALVFNESAIEILENNLDKLDTNIIYNKNIYNSIKLRTYVEQNINNFSIQELLKNKDMIKSKIINDILKEILNEIDYFIINDPNEAFESDIIYTYFKNNFNIINWSYIFEYDEFIKSKKMIELIQYIFSTNNLCEYNWCENDLWNQILKCPYSIITPEIYSIICDNKNNIDYFILANNKNLFSNINI